MDVTPSCTRESYSLSVVITGKKWALAQNSWFMDLQFNRNCCNRWESYCCVTHTKWVSPWSLPKPRCICSVPATAPLTWSCSAPLPSQLGKTFCQPQCWIPASHAGNWFLTCIFNWEERSTVFTHTSICWMPRNCSWNEKKKYLAQLFLQELPRGIWRWGRGMDLAKGGENLQLMWSE